MSDELKKFITENGLQGGTIIGFSQHEAPSLMEDKMDNYKQDILDALHGETVEAIVIGAWEQSAYSLRNNGWNDRSGRNPEAIKEITGKVITWEEAEKWLDYMYDGGYGGEDCHPVTIWTATRVLFCGLYDGSTWVTSVPRHPIEHNPEFVGGG